MFVVVALSSGQSIAAEWIDRTGQTNEVDKEWKVTFSQAIDGATVTAANVRVTNAENKEVATTVRVEREQLYVKPVVNYTPGQRYTLYIDAGIQSVKGKELKSSIRFTFDVTGQEQPEMQVHFLDVGQGDSILIQSPSGKNMLIDAGTWEAGPHVLAFLKSKGVTSLDYVVATHPHADHIGGLADVLRTIPIGQFIDSGRLHTSVTYTRLLELLDKKGVPFTVAKTGQVIDFDPLLTTTVLYADEQSKLVNDASVVLRIVYDSVSFVLTGDAEVVAETAIATNYNNIESTYLKAGHHGSYTSSNKNFLDAVKPQHTIFSYAQGNDYGHPHQVVIDRLRTVGSEIYATAQAGDITVTTNGVQHAISAAPWSPVSVEK